MCVKILVTYNHTKINEKTELSIDIKSHHLILQFFQVTMGTDYFSNVMTMFAHFRSNLYHFIDAPVDKTTYTWNLISFPFTVNAFHLQQLNSIGKIY